ncbi:T cell/B cell stimulating protein TspB, partial [Neisseria gonorrhoeae]
PQPKTFHVFGRQYRASYEPLCVFAEKIRFAVLLAFIIMSAFVVFGSLGGGNKCHYFPA